MTNPYGIPFLPQANPSEGGSGGIGSDLQGTQLRDWTLPKILARITGHGTNNAYSFTQVQADTTAAGWSNFDGAISGNTTTTAAYEANGRTDVATGTIVEMTPTYGTFNGYTFLMPGGGGHGSVVEAAVHVTSGPTGSPSTYTVKSVARDSGGALVETTPVRTYTGVYEAQNRNALVDPTSTPTHELPLWVDENGKYYFQIDQYTDGSASPTLPGHVSTTTQSIKGVKTFIDTTYFQASIDVTTGGTFHPSVDATGTVGVGPGIFGDDITTVTIYDDVFGTGWQSFSYGLYPSTTLDPLGRSVSWFYQNCGGYAIGRQPTFGSPPAWGTQYGQWATVGATDYFTGDPLGLIFSGGILTGLLPPVGGGAGGSPGGGSLVAPKIGVGGPIVGIGGPGQDSPYGPIP